jgi:hypothetical protein
MSAGNAAASVSASSKKRGMEEGQQQQQLTLEQQQVFSNTITDANLWVFVLKVLNSIDSSLDTTARQTQTHHTHTHTHTHTHSWSSSNMPLGIAYSNMRTANIRQIEY